MSQNGYKQNGWPPLGVHPGDAEPDDTEKLVALIEAAFECPPECDCICERCWVEKPWSPVECTCPSKLAA